MNPIRAAGPRGHDWCVLFAKKGGDPEFPKGDRGRGTLDDYRFDLLPANKSVVIRLAGSDPHQDAIAQASHSEEITTAIPRRSEEDERTDAPMPVRLFVDGRVIGPVGRVPRGLEGVVNEALSRLDIAGKKPRIPVEVVTTRQGLRIELQMWETR